MTTVSPPPPPGRKMIEFPGSRELKQQACFRVPTKDLNPWFCGHITPIVPRPQVGKSRKKCLPGSSSK